MGEEVVDEAIGVGIGAIGLGTGECICAIEVRGVGRGGKGARGGIKEVYGGIITGMVCSG